MYSLLRKVIDFLIAGDCAGARVWRSARSSDDYVSRLLDEGGNLTRTGLEASIEYPLDSEVKKVLKCLLMSPTLPISMTDRIQRVLEIFQLIDRDGRLTEFGRIRAIENLPLSTQCDVLGIGLRQLSLPKQHGRVEIDALNYFESQGWRGIPYEGLTFFILLKALCFEVLMSFSRGASPDVVLEAALVQWPDTETTPESRRDRFLQALQAAGPDELCSGFRAFFPRSDFEGWGPGLSVDFLLELFQSIHKEQLCGLATFFMENPYGHRKGWPDLTLVSQSAVKLVEIKTIDRLRFSQIRALPRIKAVVPDVEILQVKRAS